MTSRRTNALILAMAMISIAFVPIGPMADTEPNDDFANAEPITGGTYTGTLTDPADPSDYYKFDVSAGYRIEVAITCDSNELSAYIADPDEYWISQIDADSSVTNYLYYQTAYETTFTYCYLKFETNAGDISYSFTLVFTYGTEGSGIDAPADRTQGYLVTEGSFTGKVNAGAGPDYDEGEDAMDCYRFWAGEGDRINISFRSEDPGKIYLNLLDPGENYIFQDLGSVQSFTVHEEWWTANETGLGIYFIEVYQDLTPGSYTITLDVQRQDDGGTGEDAPLDTTFSPVATEGIVQGHLEDLDIVDIFQFTAGEGDVISVGFQGYSEGDYLYVDLFDQSITPLVSNKSSSADSGIQFLFYTANETTDQAFYMRVWMDTAPGDYVITLGIEKQNDAGAMIDVPGDSNTGSMLVAGSYEGWIFDLDTEDMYMINLTGGDILTVTLSISDGTMASWRLFNSTLIGILVEGTSSMGTPSTSSYYYDGMMDPQTCYLKIYDGQARYSLGIALSRQNDAGSGTDAPGTISASTLSDDPLPIGAGSFSGFIHNSGDMFDSYLINVTAGNRLNLTVTPSAELAINAMLYGDGRAQYAMDLLNAQGVTAYLQYDFTEDGWAQFILQINTGIGDYSFVVAITEIPGDVNTTPSAPVLTVTPGPGKNTLSWTVPSDDGGTAILGYRILRGTSMLGTPTLLTTVGASDLTYEDTMVVSGMLYVYYVLAYNAVGDGEQSNMGTGTPEPASTDGDGDGMPDAWEDENGLNKELNDAAMDRDGDGYPNIAEYSAGSKPNDKDSTPADIDGDGMPSAWEITFEFNPNDPSDADDDPDNDGRDNLQEYKDGTNPKVKDVAIGDDDDETEFPWVWVGVCCGGSFLALIVLLIIILLVVASRKKKGKAEE